MRANEPLPEGFQLENYRVRKVLSCGGFSIVYLAEDENELPVAIKEYLPAALALRRRGEALPVVPADNLSAFRYGMKCFFEEGKSLAGLQHANVVRVFNFFRANETAYMVMRFERGRTLLEHIRHHRGSLKEDFVRSTFASLLNGLREVHSNKLLHLDIKPANIYLRNDGSPLLIDFGAARQMLSEQALRLAPIYTPGYAAPEQYRARESLGPWSDIYGIGATLYACLGAAPPPAADERLREDKYLPAATRWRGEHSDELLHTIDWCLRLDHLARPQSVYALQKALAPEGAAVAARDNRLRNLARKLADWRARALR